VIVSGCATAIDPTGERMNPARHTTAAAVVLSVAGGLLAGATTSASAAASCTSPVYKRQFFANTAFSGTAKKTDCDNAIDQTWTGAPASGLPKDNFGVQSTSYTDTGLTNGTTYYYAVATVAATGAESELSPEVSATPSA
jgi:hypothetical protein